MRNGLKAQLDLKTMIGLITNTRFMTTGMVRDQSLSDFDVLQVNVESRCFRMSESFGAEDVI